jgi:putative Ca2+/H+ antiporter (TMEM165/GDT1 family)
MALSIDYYFPLLSTFVIVALAEFGDKTQIAVISLSAKHRPKAVFTGAILAFALVDGVIALVSSDIGLLVPSFWIGLIGGFSFLVFGVYTIFTKENMAVKIKERSNIMLTSFFLVSILEFGDKAQLAIIALSAEYDSPIQVFTGFMLAFTLLTALGVALGKTLYRYMSAESIKIGTGLVFLAFGVLLLFETLIT